MSTLVIKQSLFAAILIFFPVTSLASSSHWDSRLRAINEASAEFFKEPSQGPLAINDSLDQLIGSYVVIRGSVFGDDLLSIFYEDYKPWRGSNLIQRRLRFRFITRGRASANYGSVVTSLPDVHTEEIGKGYFPTPDPYSAGGHLDGKRDGQSGHFIESNRGEVGHSIWLSVMHTITNFRGDKKWARAINGDTRSHNVSLLLFDTLEGELSIKRKSVLETTGPFNLGSWGPVSGPSGKTLTFDARYKKFSSIPLDLDRMALAERLDKDCSVNLTTLP